MAKTMSFGYDRDGGLGDRLLAAVLPGEKTATSSLAVEYLSGEPLPRVGERLSLIDHAGHVHAQVETTRVTITPLHLVDDQVARDEGEGFADAADWRRAHVAYWAESPSSSAARPATLPGSSARLNLSSCSGSGCWDHTSRSSGRLTNRLPVPSFQPNEVNAPRSSNTALDAHAISQRLPSGSAMYADRPPHSLVAGSAIGWAPASTAAVKAASTCPSLSTLQASVIPENPAGAGRSGAASAASSSRGYRARSTPPSRKPVQLSSLPVTSGQPRPA